MASHERPLEATAALAGGLHLVTEDGCGIAAIVVDVLRARGAEASLVADEDLADVDRLRIRLADLRAAHGPVRGIVHLAPACRRVLSDTPAAWHGEARVTTKWLFRLLHHTADDLDRAGTDAVVLAVTGMGGEWGRRACPPGTEMAAGCHGLLRSFQREYPDLHAAVIDVDPDRPAAETAHAVVDEFLSRAPDREVGYPAGRRIVFAARRAPLDGGAPRIAWPPAPGSVVLVTGGARGVTAEICRDVAAPGVRLVIAGRTPDTQLAESARAHLRAFESQGAIVEYHAVDVRDDAAAGALVEEVYARHGRIDGVLHGAGLIDDQRVALKSEDSFDRVFDTKVTGALALARHLRPAGLAWVVFFSSVSGRFGNPGQGDYGAANETLNRLAWTLQRRWPATRVVAINWGPWRGTGMMSDAILKVAAARGLQPIDVAAGRRFLVDELQFGAPADVEVIAGDGPWAAAVESETQKLEHA
jgi:NAD(P)-dependent dehydrogenase (short-subunit alcohol dehydrogenase family)